MKPASISQVKKLLRRAMANLEESMMMSLDIMEEKGLSLDEASPQVIECLKNKSDQHVKLTLTISLPNDEELAEGEESGWKDGAINVGNTGQSNPADMEKAAELLRKLFK